MARRWIQSPANMSKAWRSLDVSVLHKLILEKFLGIGEKQLASESNIEYIKDVGNAIDESIASVDGEKNQVVFLYESNPDRAGAAGRCRRGKDAAEVHVLLSEDFYWLDN